MSAPPITERRTAARRRSPPLRRMEPKARGRIAWWMLAAAGLAVCALSLLLPGAPTYDPWAWIIWGREITHGTLETEAGPSWKPLPVLLTTPFALAGDEAAPQLWLVVGRAGALLALVMAFRLGRRIAGPAAGIVAAAGIMLADGFLRHAWRGFSEALLVGLVLWAIERHLDGRHRQAFLLGLGAALLRPEVWPFWGLYGLWMAWRHPRTRALVAAGYAAIPLGWFLPEWIGSGDFLRAAERARQPNLDSAAYAERPFLEVFERSAPLLSVPIYAGALIALAWAVRRRDRTLLACAGGALALMVVVGLMTEAGFAGNLRYVILPAALICLLAGAGWTRVVGSLGRMRGALLAVALLAAAVPFVLHDGRDLRDDWAAIRSEADFAESLDAAIAKAGGERAVNSCGGVYTGRFQVPLVAWELHRPIQGVEIFPYPPGVVLGPRFSALSVDPRFTKVTETRKWIVRRSCP